MWKKRIFKDGSIKWTERRKYIILHKNWLLWWIDYGMVKGPFIGTLGPYKTKKKALKNIKLAKREFRFEAD